MRSDWLNLLRLDQRLTYGIDPDDMSELEVRRYVNDMAHALFQETAEFTSEFPWKPWKDYFDFELLPEQVAFEAADILHFLGHLLNVANVSDKELEEAFMEKRRINARRQQEGY